MIDRPFAQRKEKSALVEVPDSVLVLATRPLVLWNTRQFDLPPRLAAHGVGAKDAGDAPAHNHHKDNRGNVRGGGQHTDSFLSREKSSS